MDKNIESILEEKGQKISELTNKRDQITKKKIEMFNAYVQKIRPTLQFIKDNKLGFGDPEDKFISPLGPIIGHDDIYLYVYDLDVVCIKKINMRNQEEEVIPKHNFFNQCNFQEAMDGLEYVERIPDIILQDLSKDIEKDELLLDNYKSKI